MNGYKHLTQAQRVQILELFHQQLPTPAIVERLGVSGEQVRGALHRAGLKPTRKHTKSCFQHFEEIRRMAAEGRSLSEMARTIGANKRHVKGFLERHNIPYQRFRQAGPNNPAWRGGTMLDKRGYLLVHRPEHHAADQHGYVRQHRLVMEEKLGRPLLSNEVVHHRDEDPANNDPDNLELFQSNGRHLAATLKGKTPRWTPEGEARILEGLRRGRAKLAASIRRRQETDDLPSQCTPGQTAS